MREWLTKYWLPLCFVVGAFTTLVLRSWINLAWGGIVMSWAIAILASVDAVRREHRIDHERALREEMRREHEAFNQNILSVIRERLAQGSLIEAEHGLALRFYEQLREDLLAAAVHQNQSFSPGESLYLILRSSRREDLEEALRRMHTAPPDAPGLTPEEEGYLLKLIATNPSWRPIIIQWMFASRSLDAIYAHEDHFSREEVTRAIVRALPKLGKSRYSEALNYLASMRHLLRGDREALLRLKDLQDRLTRWDDPNFDNTVEVIAAIDSRDGVLALRKLAESLPEKVKDKRDQIDKLSGAISA